MRVDDVAGNVGLTLRSGSCWPRAYGSGSAPSHPTRRRRRSSRNSLVYRRRSSLVCRYTFNRRRRRSSSSTISLRRAW